MKKVTFFFALILSFQYLVAQPVTDSQLTTAFDKILSVQYKSDAPGATALVARKGQIIYQKAIGMANMELDVPLQVDDIFRIGSITKQFTAIAILQLMEKGKLNLQDDLTKYIPDYPTQGNKITIEHLLTHTSGIQPYTEMQDFIERMKMDLTPTEMIDHFKNEPMTFAPGTKYNYNNSGYFLLGYIIEKITGKPYGEYVEENFFKPLGMTHSLYSNDSRIIKRRAAAYSEGEQGYENAPSLSLTQPFSAGSIQSSVGDLFIWHQALHSYKLVKKETLDKAFTKYKLLDGSEVNYGYGWTFGFVQQSPTIEHGGAINGFGTMAIYLPKEDVFVAVFANCDCNPPKDVAARLAALAIGKPYEHMESPLDKSVMESYTGVYENEKGEQRIISLDGNQLYSQRGQNQKFKIKAYEPDKFYFDDALLTIQFLRNEKGMVQKLLTDNREGHDVWFKTDKQPLAQKEIKLDEHVLEKYTGEYAINPAFTFTVTRENSQLFLQATGQEKVEIYAESETKFFLKVNDARLEFAKDDSGKVTKAILAQGGRSTEAMKIK